MPTTAKLPTRELAPGATVPTPGFGAMGLSAFYSGHSNDEANLKLLKHAYDLGCRFWDTADIYSSKEPSGDNERLIGQFLKTVPREDIFLATKFAIKTEADGSRSIHGEPEYVKQACANSLKNLGVDQIDLYYQHRVDSKTPIEETIKAMDELRKEGKIKYIGMSECSAETLRKANKVAKVDVLQVEYSLWTTDIENNGILDTCKELGVSIAAYSPLGRGMLTGQFKKFDDIPEHDFRRHNPRFSKENFPKNLELVHEVEKLAAKKGCTPGQLALAWVMTQWERIVPIPGTTRIKALDENVASTQVVLNSSELKEIRSILDQFPTAGDRYHPNMMATVNI